MSIVEKLEEALSGNNTLGRRKFFKGAMRASAAVGALAAGLRVEDAAACTPVCGTPVGKVACCILAHQYCYDYGLYGCHCQTKAPYTWYCTDTNTYVYQCNECDNYNTCVCCCSWFNLVGRAKDIKWDMTQFRVVPEIAENQRAIV